MAYPSQLERAAPILIASVRAGLTRTLACKVAGISLRALDKWLVRAEQRQEPEYVDFAEKLAQAEGELAAELVGRIRVASEDDWGAAKYLLERLNPKDYGPPATDVKLTIDAKPARERLVELIARAKERRVQGAEPLLIEQREPTDETPRGDE